MKVVPYLSRELHCELLSSKVIAQAILLSILKFTLDVI